jgi:hypothetical protein
MGCIETVIENGVPVERDCHTHRAVTSPPPPSSGPGTELKKLLAGWPFRIVAKPTCSCNAKARAMDAGGCDWCEENLDTIVGWLREEAAKRKLFFVDLAGRMLVKRAIRNARKAGQSSEPPRTA